MRSVKKRRAFMAIPFCRVRWNLPRHGAGRGETDHDREHEAEKLKSTQNESATPSLHEGLDFQTPVKLSM
jgi:hypothetical protein